MFKTRPRKTSIQEVLDQLFGEDAATEESATNASFVTAGNLIATAETEEAANQEAAAEALSPYQQLVDFGFDAEELVERAGKSTKLTAEVLGYVQPLILAGNCMPFLKGLKLLHMMETKIHRYRKESAFKKHDVKAFDARLQKFYDLKDKFIDILNDTIPNNHAVCGGMMLVFTRAEAPCFNRLVESWHKGFQKFLNDVIDFSAHDVAAERKSDRWETVRNVMQDLIDLAQFETGKVYSSTGIYKLDSFAKSLIADKFDHITSFINTKDGEISAANFAINILLQCPKTFIVPIARKKYYALIDALCAGGNSELALQLLEETARVFKEESVPFPNLLTKLKSVKKQSKVSKNALRPVPVPRFTAHGATLH